MSKIKLFENVNLENNGNNEDFDIKAWFHREGSSDPHYGRSSDKCSAQCHCTSSCNWFSGEYNVNIGQVANSSGQFNQKGAFASIS